MNAPPHVIFISNDVVPGCGLPVAAPGLRVFGLATGLVARGYAVTTVIVRGPLARQWRRPVPPSLPRDTLSLRGDQLAAYLTTQSPAVVVLTNSAQVDRLPQADGNRYVLDCFAPKLLELVYERGPDAPYPLAEAAELRARKLRAIERADGFIVNGLKKLPYFLAWILQTDRDVRDLPFEHVGMCLPASFSEAEPAIPRTGPVRFAMAGYLLGWSVPGEWLRCLEPHLRAGECELTMMMPPGGIPGTESPALRALGSSPGVTRHAAVTFAEYQRLVGEADVVLDLHDRTRERELAVVTRAIVALCAGKPVVHPPFTEVAALIAEFEAGWLVDPAEPGAVAAALAEILSDRDEIERRARGARALWRAHLDPSVAVSGLDRVIGQLSVPVEKVG